MATIITKFSSTSSAVPTASDLVQGELAVNTADKRLFTEDSGATIIEIGTNPSSITTGAITATGTVTANSNLSSSNAVLTGGTVNGIVIGGSTPQAVTGTLITANTGFAGALTGNVTGNVTGNLTGNITGDVTGNLTASSGTTTVNDLVVNGTVDFTDTVLTNLAAPSSDTDAATKGYVDTQVTNLVGGAPAALDTLNELAAALNDDAAFNTTITNSIATKLPLAGGTMSGAIAMGTNKITGLGTPTAGTDASTKAYADTMLPLAGGTMTGNIVLGSNKATSTATPSTDDDLTRKGYVDSILGSATSAATSAAAAATSASNAATSASNAATSESNASTSASNAAASYDAFDDRYLGAKASDPTLDNDGDALVTGALYFNTTSNVMKVYDGAAWNIAAISSASPTFTGTVTADGLSLGDNEKAQFGNSNDLQIYHDGSNSYVQDAGSGNLYLRQNGTAVIIDDGTNNLAAFNSVSGESSLYYGGSGKKLATTSTGIDVTGTVIADGLTVNTTDVTIDFTKTNAGSFKLNLSSKNYTSISLLADSDGTPQDWLLSAMPQGPFRIWDQTNLAERFQVANNGDISFYEDTGTTPKFFWDASAESLGIGVSSSSNASGNLVVGTTTGGNITLTRESESYAQNDLIGRIDWFNEDNSGEGQNVAAYIGAYAAGSLGDDAYLTFNTVAAGAAGADASESMRIDSSGNLLVGTTDPDVSFSTSAGSSLQSSGQTHHSSSGTALVLNRTASDGTIAQFRKAGTTVGSIGTVGAGSEVYIAGNTTGLQFSDTAADIRPCTATGSSSDATTDLGDAVARFQDIYATNGTIQTSDRNEKQDIEALSDAEQRVAVAAKGLLRKFRWKSAVEEKGDEARIHFGIIAQDLQAAFEAEGLDAGRYAMFIHSTWTDEETGEERSRMGVRYSELLAFIIAAI